MINVAITLRRDVAGSYANMIQTTHNGVTVRSHGPQFVRPTYGWPFDYFPLRRLVTTERDGYFAPRDVADLIRAGCRTPS